MGNMASKTTSFHMCGDVECWWCWGWYYWYWWCWCWCWCWWSGTWCGWRPFSIISASSARQIASLRESLEIYILDCFPTLSLRTWSDLSLYYNSILNFEDISHKVIQRVIIFLCKLSKFVLHSLLHSHLFLTPCNGASVQRTFFDKFIPATHFTGGGNSRWKEFWKVYCWFEILFQNWKIL